MDFLSFLMSLGFLRGQGGRGGGGGNPTINDVLENGNEVSNPDKNIVFRSPKSEPGYNRNEASVGYDGVRFYYTNAAEGQTPTHTRSVLLQSHGMNIGKETNGWVHTADIHPGSIYLTSGNGEEEIFFAVTTDPGTGVDVQMDWRLSSAFQNALGIGNLNDLTTPVTDNIVAALNSVQTEIDGLDEPFRVKNWSVSTLNVNIPTCTQDIANTAIPKMEFSISDEEGADYQIVGMIAYEVFDASNNRINCWPVCQFTGNGQKTLTVRMMCAGTEQKTAKRISAWVLLKHR